MATTHTTALLTQKLNGVLPQTQCRRCGYNGCEPYANAMATGEALHNRCPPGGAIGQKILAQLLGVDELDMDEGCGRVGPRTIAFIHADLCIGCTKCIEVCPTDAIVGAPKKLHFVIAEFCTGCDLCLPPCPVDCITMQPQSGRSPDMAYSWLQWSQQDADRSKQRFDRKVSRLQPLSTSSNATTQPVVSISSAVERAREKAKQRLNL
jgi:Na+-translocating ferredoxin:NAD+ oxidoreductase subunit B